MGSEAYFIWVICVSIVADIFMAPNRQLLPIISREQNISVDRSVCSLDLILAGRDQKLLSFAIHNIILYGFQNKVQRKWDYWQVSAAVSLTKLALVAVLAKNSTYKRPHKLKRICFSASFLEESRKGTWAYWLDSVRTFQYLLQVWFCFYPSCTFFMLG